MKCLGIAVFLVLGAVSQVYGQTESVGVSPYHHPEVAQYRAMFGTGGNLGHSSDAPLAYIGSVSYQLGNSLYGLSLLESESVAFAPPRVSLTELDVLYGLAFDEDITRYHGSPQSFHASFSAGVGFQAYNTRWRFGRRGQFDTTGFAQSGVDPFQPNTTEVTACFPIQVQALYEPFSFAGIGLSLFASFSKLTPSYGGAVVVQARY